MMRFDANAHSRGQAGRNPRPKAGTPLDHTYYIQSSGDTRIYDDAHLAQPAGSARYRATCDVCPWLGDWHQGFAGVDAAEAEGAKHRASHRGLPGWPRCEECGFRMSEDVALCADCRIRETSERDRERHEEWWS